MLSLVRFLVVLAVIGGIAYGGMFALVSFVEPNPREMTVRVPSGMIDPQPVPLPQTIRIDPSATSEISTGEQPVTEQ